MEMEAMQERLGSFEISLNQGIKDQNPSKNGLHKYHFSLPYPEPKLFAGTQATIKEHGNKILVTVTEVEDLNLTLTTSTLIDLSLSQPKLYIYPWFIYKELIDQLENLLSSKDHFIDHSLRLFGKLPINTSNSTTIKNKQLNKDQCQAIESAFKNNLCFIWGPPGTGKTTTLAHLLIELFKTKQSILLTSHTNAAIDQALASIYKIGGYQEGVVRIGHTDANTYGMGFKEIKHHIQEQHSATLGDLDSRLNKNQGVLQVAYELINQIREKNQSNQMSLFEEAKTKPLSELKLSQIFGSRRAKKLLAGSISVQKEALSHRYDRLKYQAELMRKRIAAIKLSIKEKIAQIIPEAKLLIATMTHMYIQPGLKDLRFDTVIIEEAGMAILPSLFFTASLAKNKVIVIGDPKQLPPVVQSNQDYVHKAMGRSIFHIANPDLANAPNLAMLQTQYRMHPTICHLVSDLFYDGKLESETLSKNLEHLASSPPEAGNPLVLMDTKGKTTCQSSPSGSRSNSENGKLCIDLVQLIINFDPEIEVGIITPYVEQAKNINHLLKKHPHLHTQVECSTVHRFQGNEKDIIVIDTVDSMPLPPGKLLTEGAFPRVAPNLINVSISRAKGKLILLADVNYFASKAMHSTLNQVLQYMLKNR